MHPIDERFKALYDAEATPPEEVRAAIGHRLGWNKSVGNGVSFPSTLLLLVGVAGSALAWYHWSDTTTSTQQEFAAIQEHQKEITTEPAASYSEATTGQAAVTSEPTSQTEAGDIDQTTVVSEGQKDGITTSVPKVDKATKGNAPSRPNAVSTNKQSTLPATTDHKQNTVLATSAKQGESGPVAQKKEASAVAAKTKGVESGIDKSEGVETGSSDTKEEQSGNTGTVAKNFDDEKTSSTAAKTDDLDEPEFTVGHSGTEAWIGPAVNIDRLDTRFALIDMEATAKQPFTAKRVADYVVPHGNYWVSIYGGLSSVKGKWSGVDAEALDRSEDWKSGWQAGALVGRTWRSGFGVGVGAGVARIHSTFSDERSSISGEAADLDTAWTTSNYPGTEIPISTWFIDTTFTPISGPQIRRTANNQYTAIQIPLSLWWHKDIRRWKVGATAGVMGWIPMKRQGLTLARPTSDAEPAPTTLSSPETEPRYGIQLHGNAGLSLGFMLCEQLTLLAEPMISAPLYRGNENTSISLSRPTIQLRLHYDIHSRIQRSK
ncbi:MAG: hypothetical protein IPI91_00270 [Flavobacteriales bacterium]|nr:hypothetical protein [Flavobacteriales bacterium]